jgi:hypothetical protein
MVSDHFTRAGEGRREKLGMKESKKKERRRDKPAATKGEKCHAGFKSAKKKDSH